jgi:hypothetical protein
MRRIGLVNVAEILLLLILSGCTSSSLTSTQSSPIPSNGQQASGQGSLLTETLTPSSVSTSASTLTSTGSVAVAVSPNITATVTPTHTNQLEWWGVFLNDIAIDKTQNFFACLAIIVGAWAAYYKFLKGRIFRPRIDLSVQGSLISKSKIPLMQITAKIKNTGLSKVRLSDVTVDVWSSKEPIANSFREVIWEHIDCYPMFGDAWIEPGESIEDQTLVPLIKANLNSATEKQEGPTAYKVRLKAVTPKQKRTATRIVTKEPSKNQSPQSPVEGSSDE